LVYRLTARILQAMFYAAAILIALVVVLALDLLILLAGWDE
jgi:hypothetical protein